MKKYKFKVLFKNGIEKTIDIEATDEKAVSVVNAVKEAYTNDLTGGLTLGFTYIRICETVCVEVEQIN